MEIIWWLFRWKPFHMSPIILHFLRYSVSNGLLSSAGHGWNLTLWQKTVHRSRTPSSAHLCSSSLGALEVKGVLCFHLCVARAAFLSTQKGAKLESFLNETV